MAPAFLNSLTGNPKFSTVYYADFRRNARYSGAGSMGMNDSTLKQGSRGPVRQNTPPEKDSASCHSEDVHAAEKKSEMLTEIFLTVAKEKNSLESVILSQNDIIKGLEKEKEDLTLSLRKLSENNKGMKEKLLNFDILRNMEISELKKKIEQLLSEGKRVTSEKDSILRNLERDQRNITQVERQTVEALIKEKRELEQRLQEFLGEETAAQKEHGIQAGVDREEDSDEASIRRLQLTIEELKKSIASGELELAGTQDRLRAAADHIQELERLNSEKARVEDDLLQKVHDFSEETSNLKTDIDELTTAIENKIQIIDDLNTKVVRLSEALGHKDSELHEQIPALLNKINSLSASIDTKMQENSFFTKELFDLNVKISALNEELTNKDELLLDLSDDYRKQRDEIEALHSAHELALRNLVHERDLLKKECEELKNMSAMPLQQTEDEQQERMILQERLSERLAEIEGLVGENARLTALISEKNGLISELQRDVRLLESKAEGAATEHDSYLSAMREKITLLNYQLLEKNELLTVMTSERDHDKDEFLRRTDLLREEKAALAKEMDRLIEIRLEQEEKLVRNISLLEMTEQAKDGLEKDLAAAEAKTHELLPEMNRLQGLLAEKDQALAAAGEVMLRLQADVTVLQTSQAGLDRQLQEKDHTAGLADIEKQGLQKAAAEYQKTFDCLKQELISLNRSIAEKEQAVEQLASDRKSLSEAVSFQEEKLDQYAASVSSLEHQLQESSRERGRLSDQNSSLAQSLRQLQSEISSLNSAREEEVHALKGELSSHERALSDLRQELDHALVNNAELRSRPGALQSDDREAQLPAIERKEPGCASDKDASAMGKRTLAYMLFALLLISVVGSAFYSINAGLIALPMQKPHAIEETGKDVIKREFDYNEMDSLLTRISASDDLKFQATLMTEPLVLKSDTPGDKALYDFQNYLYFKVIINVRTVGLDPKIIKDPYPLVNLAVGADSITPAPDMPVRESRTFYRNQVPVSIMFYSVFPRAALPPEPAAFSLSFNNGTYRADIAWDLKSLRADGLVP